MRRTIQSFLTLALVLCVPVAIQAQKFTDLAKTPQWAGTAGTSSSAQCE